MAPEDLSMDVSGPIVNDGEEEQTTTESFGWHSPRCRPRRPQGPPGDSSAAHQPVTSRNPTHDITLPTHKWGPLELRRTIGRGRFGTVYVAWDPGLEREVALKLLPSDERSVAVIQEARLLARVRHPNVVTVYGVDWHESAVGLWMELVEGLTLQQVLAGRGVLGAQEAALIGIDLCRAVAAVHKAGVLHRDVKAQNVMREAGGRIVLMDFGAGQIRAEPSSGSSWIIGTPVYVLRKSSRALRQRSPATCTAWVWCCITW